MPGKSSRRWASRFYHRRAALVMTRAADAPGQGRMRQHETAAFPPGLQAGGPQIGERGVGALPAGDEPGGGKPGFGPALERRQRLRLPDRGLPVVGGVSRHPHAVRGQGVAQPVAPLRAAHQQGARGQRGQALQHGPQGFGIVAGRVGRRMQDCCIRAKAGQFAQALRAGRADSGGDHGRGQEKPPRARVSWSRYRRAALPLTKTTMS